MPNNETDKMFGNAVAQPITVDAVSFAFLMGQDDPTDLDSFEFDEEDGYVDLDYSETL